MRTKKLLSAFVFQFLLYLSAINSFAQTTAFSFQGRLTDAGVPANGAYILQFKLFDAVSGGTQIGATVADISVTATNGVFSTAIDFGAEAFAAGANRFLEMSVKKNAADSYTVLTPRQQILSAPYSIKSRTADDSNQLGGTDAARFVQQDAGGNVSVGGNLSVSGTLSLNIVNADTQYNLGGQRILAVTNDNLFLGLNAGQFSTGLANTFIGKNTGSNNTTGNNNAFFGALTGQANTTGSFNSFFGAFSGVANETSSYNAFFGTSAGLKNNGGGNNTFVGAFAGQENESGNFNTFLGASAGLNSRAGNNTFTGAFAGFNNTTGDGNAALGAFAGFSNTTGQWNAFFGYNAGFSNTGNFNSFFGNHAGAQNTTGEENAFFGGGAGKLNTTGTRNTFIGDLAGWDFFTGIGNTTGNFNTFLGFLSGRGVTTGNNNTFLGYETSGAANLQFAAALGSNSVVNTSDTIVLGKTAGTYNGIPRPADTVQIPGNLNVAGNITGGNIVKNINGLAGNISLAAGANITITPSGNTLTIASNGGGINAILNQTTLQTSANFNIDGTGAANIFNAAMQFNQNGSRVLQSVDNGVNFGGNLYVGFGAGANTVPSGFFGTSNTFVGAGAGLLNSSGAGNTFIGSLAGEKNTGAANNTFVGSVAGRANTTGGDNSFFGNSAGLANTTGQRNTYVGAAAGNSNPTGSQNSFFGTGAGINGTSGGNNSFFGYNSGFNTSADGNSFFGKFSGAGNTTGTGNTFAGTDSGLNNTTGTGNTLLGANANVAAGNLNNAAAIGANAQVAQSDSLVLGSINGVNGATADTRVGIGTTAPKEKLEVSNGNILVGSPGQGIILKSPSGAVCRLLSLGNTGELILTPVTCP